MSEYKKNSLTLNDTVALGTGVMIGAGIFALLGQIAELSGSLFPYILIIGAIISGFSAYSYIKVSNAYPSAGGIAMILKKCYGKSVVTASAAVLMALSMVINESLVARTFGSYTLQLFPSLNAEYWIPILGVGLLIFAFIINISNNKIIGNTARFTSYLKILGIIVFAIAGLLASQLNFDTFIPKIDTDGKYSIQSYLGAIALAILAYKGFTTITNSGDEVKKPHKNVGRAIVISLIICVFVYFLVALAVKSSLTIEEIINAKDYSLAEAAKPFLGNYGLYFTIGIAILATVSGVIASVFAVSRMTTMLTNMQLIPHSHLGMPGSIQKHMVVYIVVIAIVLTIFFDLSRIASMGAIFYLVMDMIIHWGVFKYLRKDINANKFILLTALLLDLIVLIGFIWIKSTSDLFIVILSISLVLAVFIFEKWFIQTKLSEDKSDEK